MSGHHLREPAALVWTIRDGEPDWADTEPDPVPVPTVAWVSWHLGWWWTVAIDHVHGRTPRDRTEVTWPGPTGWWPGCAARATSGSPCRRACGHRAVRGRVPHNGFVASYSVHPAGVEHARRLIDARQYVLRGQWRDAQPDAEAGNRYLATHSWEDYGSWHLAVTDGAGEETKARYAFVFGDFRRLHRMGLIACHYRAAEWGHKEVELAAHDLLQYLDNARA